MSRNLDPQFSTVTRKTAVPAAQPDLQVPNQPALAVPMAAVPPGAAVPVGGPAVRAAPRAPPPRPISVRVGASSPTSSAAFSNAGCRPPASHLILGSAAAAAPNGFGYSRGRLLLMTLRAVTWSQQAPPSPLREPPSTSRRGAAPARALACPSACATGARTEWAIPKPVLRAGGRVVATAPAPSSARGSSAIIIAGCTSHFTGVPDCPSGNPEQSAKVPILLDPGSRGQYRDTGAQPAPAASPRSYCGESQRSSNNGACRRTQQ